MTPLMWMVLYEKNDSVRDYQYFSYCAQISMQDHELNLDVMTHLNISCHVRHLSRWTGARVQYQFFVILFNNGIMTLIKNNRGGAVKLLKAKVNVNNTLRLTQKWFAQLNIAEHKKHQ